VAGIDVRDELPEEHRATRAPEYAIVAEDVDDLLDPAFVIFPDFDPTKRWGPYFWQPRNDTDLPQRGDECLVIYDNRRNGRIVWWRPTV
jgi:hypothetical protein